MEILETRVYRGPNTYALWPMIRLQLDLGELEDHPTAELPGFTDRLIELVPTLSDHTCGLGVEGGFILRMREDRGTWLGHVLEHLAIELQCLAGTPVSFGKTRQENLPRGRYHVAYSYREEPVGLGAGRLALSVIRHLLPPERPAHDPSPFDHAAYTAELDRLVQLARSCTLDPTTAALVEAAERRDIPWIRLDHSLVQLGHGRHQRHIHESLTSEERQIAVEIASDRRLTHRVLEGLGLPVQEAPNEAEGQKAYSILVVDGKVVAAAEPNGTDRTDRTADLHEDNRVMAELAVQAIGLGVGGVGFVSPDIARSYKEAGGAITGIQASPTLGLYLGSSGGRRRKMRHLTGPILDMLFPEGSPASIPISTISGGNRSGKTTVARMVGHILSQAGHAVGMATSDGVSIDGTLAVPGDMTGPLASQLVLRDPRVDAAVLETSCDGLESSGLGWDRCGVAAVLNAESRELAKLLRTVVEVARDSCVLNADDPRVAALAEHSPADPIYVTRNVRNELVRRHVGGRGKAVVLEGGISGPRLVLYNGEEQIQLLRARQIPATQDGASAQNIHNAMFAAAVAIGMGVAVDDIREGLRTFAAEAAEADKAETTTAIVDFQSRVQKRDEEARKEPVFEPVLEEEPVIQARRAG